MRTTLDIPEALMDEAMALTHSATKTDLIKKALEDVIQKEKIARIKGYFGKVDLELDLDSLAGGPLMVMVDTSVWIDYFRGRAEARALDALIDTNQVCTNELVLTELVPALVHRRQTDLVDLLFTLARVPLSIDWAQIRTYQGTNLKNGFNHVGIPDLILAQNCLQNNLTLLTQDKHFASLARSLPLSVHSY